MAITKDSEKVLRAKIVEINKRLDQIDRELVPLENQKAGLNSRIDQLKDEREKLKASKNAIQTDTGA